MGIRDILMSPRKVIPALASRGFLQWLPDKAYLKTCYYGYMGQKLNLKEPKAFTEKLQWLKLYDRIPRYTVMVDKYEAKKYIAETVGEKYVIPTLGVWHDAEEIDFEELPDQFVLKCTHDSGSVEVCANKALFDKKAAVMRLRNRLKKNYYYRGREWPYKNVKPRIVAEMYLEDTAEDALTDYKFFCFGGKARVMYISKDHGANPRTDFFDMEFNHLPIKVRDPNADIPPKKPKQFEKMKQLAEILSKDIPHLRVDFYIVNDRLYIGELTFYHMSGFAKITPHEWDICMGSWITLPDETDA